VVSIGPTAHPEDPAVLRAVKFAARLGFIEPTPRRHGAVRPDIRKCAQARSWRRLAFRRRGGQRVLSAPGRTRPRDCFRVEHSRPSRAEIVTATACSVTGAVGNRSSQSERAPISSPRPGDRGPERSPGS
jgi:hypothetical protein